MERDAIVRELESLDSVIEVELKGEVIGFNVDRGEYNSLSSELLSVLGRYDFELYVFDDESWKYRLV